MPLRHTNLMPCVSLAVCIETAVFTAVCSHAEDNMFRDYPELGNEYTDVFYGSVGSSPRNSLDEEIIEKAKQVSGGLFERAGH